MLTSYLLNEGWDVTTFLCGEEAIKKISDGPSIWILDIMLPGINGYELLKKIKENNKDIPVIFISARDAEIDRVIGLEMGCDDYIAKPFLPRELVVRIKNLLKRVKEAGNKVDETIEIDNYCISLDKRNVVYEGKVIELTSKEFELLILLLKNLRSVFSREQILKHIWGDDYFGSKRVVDDLVRRLRRQVPNLRIETIYGYGYRLM